MPLARMQTQQPDKRLLQCPRAWIFQKCPRDEAQEKGCPEVSIGGTAALDQLLEHSARVRPDLVQHGGLLNTGDAAERSTFFHDGVLLFDVLLPVVGQWNARVTPLLRTPMDQSVLADIEKARARAAVPQIG